jgi:hypothetical protein
MDRQQSNRLRPHGIKKIVGFGDSWMYGDELIDPALQHQDDAHACLHTNTPYREGRCALGLLGSHYGVPTENFGIPGGSLESTEWTYLWWLDHEPAPEQCLVLVFLTESNRATFYNPNHVHYSNDPPWNKFVHSTWVHFGSSVIGSEFTDMIKRYLVLTECEDLWDLRYRRAVMLLDGWAARLNIPTLQFNTMPPIRSLPGIETLIWPEFNWSLFFREHPDNRSRALIKPGGHPNEKGHEIIRDMLIPEIDRVILGE